MSLSPESMRFAKCIPERCHGCSLGFLILIYINTAFSCIYTNHITSSRYTTLCMNDFIVASLCPQDRYCAIQTSQRCWWLFTITKFPGILVFVCTTFIFHAGREQPFVIFSFALKVKHSCKPFHSLVTRVPKQHSIRKYDSRLSHKGTVASTIFLKTPAPTCVFRSHCRHTTTSNPRNIFVYRTQHTIIRSDGGKYRGCPQATQ